MRTLLSAVLGACGLAVASAAMVTALPQPVAACPTYNGSPHFGTIALNEGFLPDPYYRNVTAGGTQNIGNCSVPGWGWTARRPDFRIQYNSSGNSALSFVIRSNADTVLLINDPYGNWHFDDDGGQDLGAFLKFSNAPGGQWDIWIGSFNQARGIPAALEISERY
ncbi:MAG: hypothetical protein KI785_01180 [Devosiaceae bacterium]|nr:hypothetical protein [Devosiaceae bacterium MH13]